MWVWVWCHTRVRFLPTTHHSRVTNLWDPMHYTDCRALLRGPGGRPPIDAGDQTHNLFNGPQVQQRREAHKDPDQGGLLLHRREQEVQEHNSESFQPLSRTLKKEIPPLEFINKSSRSLNEVSKPEFYFSCVHKNSHD